MTTYQNGCLRQIAAQVLDRKGQDSIDKKLREGKIATAKNLILSGVDDFYRHNPKRFVEAAGFYNQADIPVGDAGGRAGQFPQLGVTTQ